MVMVHLVSTWRRAKVREHSLFMPGRGLAKIMGGSSKFFAIEWGVTQKIGSGWGLAVSFFLQKGNGVTVIFSSTGGGQGFC